MVDQAALLEMYRLLHVEAQERMTQTRTWISQIGTYGNIARSTTPMWRSQVGNASGAITPDWIRQHFYKQEYDEPEIPDYLRVSEGL